jgi:hypothetical protein
MWPCPAGVGVHHNTLRKMRDDGEIRYRLKDLEALVEFWVCLVPNF